ncbi:hypothetical protein J6590_017993 [Homalodisca vitripennis]|nr:hypothetical protein J6590_017993 [Homalodisca vitripennis]
MFPINITVTNHIAPPEPPSFDTTAVSGQGRQAGKAMVAPHTMAGGGPGGSTNGRPRPPGPINLTTHSYTNAAAGNPITAHAGSVFGTYSAYQSTKFRGRYAKNTVSATDTAMILVLMVWSVREIWDTAGAGCAKCVLQDDSIGENISINNIIQLRKRQRARQLYPGPGGDTSLIELQWRSSPSPYLTGGRRGVRCRDRCALLASENKLGMERE